MSECSCSLGLGPQADIMRWVRLVTGGSYNEVTASPLSASSPYSQEPHITGNAWVLGPYTEMKTNVAVGTRFVGRPGVGPPSFSVIPSTSYPIQIGLIKY